MSDYPEHEKLKARREEARILSEFLDFLEAEHVHFAKWNDHDRLDPASHADPRFRNNEGIIGAFLDIDPDALSREKDAMYASLRGEE